MSVGGIHALPCVPSVAGTLASFKPDARRGAPTVRIIQSVQADLYALAPEAVASLQSLA